MSEPSYFLTSCLFCYIYIVVVVIISKNDIIRDCSRMSPPVFLSSSLKSSIKRNYQSVLSYPTGRSHAESQTKIVFIEYDS